VHSFLVSRKNNFDTMNSVRFSSNRTYFFIIRSLMLRRAALSLGASHCTQKNGGSAEMISLSSSFFFLPSTRSFSRAGFSVRSEFVAER